MLKNYQELFLTPGISPSCACSRKQIRQRSKSRIYPCLRPHWTQRRTTRLLYFGVRVARTFTDVRAIYFLGFRDQGLGTREHVGKTNIQNPIPSASIPFFSSSIS